MAWTEAERLNIRLYTGRSDRYLQEDAALERALSSTSGKVETEAMVRAILAEIVVIESELTGSHTRLQASKLGSITLNSQEIAKLRSRGREKSGRLCQIFGVEGRNDPWSGRMPRTRAGRRGNYLPHG
jgi:hypothetical protein